MKKLFIIAAVLILAFFCASCAKVEPPIISAGEFSGISIDPDANAPKLLIYNDDTYKLQIDEKSYCIGSITAAEREGNIIANFHVEIFEGDLFASINDFEMLICDDDVLLLKTELKGEIVADTQFYRTLRGTPAP